MAVGPGKYDDECTQLREATDAQAVLVLILNGKHGHGLSIQVADPAMLPTIADLLEAAAAGIRQGQAH